jgi:hypothetical protein
MGRVTLKIEHKGFKMAEYFTGFESYTSKEESDEQQRKTLAATKQIGRPPKSTREMRDIKKAVDAANKEQRRLERAERCKELRRKKNLEVMKAKYHNNKEAAKQKYRDNREAIKAKYHAQRENVVKHIPINRICPICKQHKPRNQQWSIVENTTLCTCQGCIRVFGDRLARLTKLYENLKT